MRFIIQLWSDERAASTALIEALAEYNERLASEGVLLAAEGLVSSGGVRITLADGERSTHTGPFADAPRLGSGFWIVRARSKEEAVAWAGLCPLREGDVLEVRQLYGSADLALIHTKLALA